ncbi:VOC family protein [Streptomyces beijiangensis]|uniref:VOC family protein n=1 Tax=Streptomyces beijiangensis TaxID=163361 RepID=A0A939F263_9ACTN|nr:VOC family protein [Streptomyces beijiangensis]MBO0510399.1 VOC family protein [Streptomyces beijiangensis]
MQKITPTLWFDDQAEEAARFYTSLFKNSRIVEANHYGDSGPGKPGSVMVVTFELDGQRYSAFNGGPEFRFTEAISLYVDCSSQEEVDDLWSRLTADGGQESQCGWLKDKFGLSWQIIPKELTDLLSDPDGAKAGRVMQAMMGMGKIEVQALREAAAG